MLRINFVIWHAHATSAIWSSVIRLTTSTIVLLALGVVLLCACSHCCFTILKIKTMQARVIEGCYEPHPHVGVVKVLYCNILLLFPPPFCMMTTVQPRTTGSQVKSHKNPGFESAVSNHD